MFPLHLSDIRSWNGPFKSFAVLTSKGLTIVVIASLASLSPPPPPVMALLHFQWSGNTAHITPQIQLTAGRTFIPRRAGRKIFRSIGFLKLLFTLFLKGFGYHTSVRNRMLWHVKCTTVVMPTHFHPVVDDNMMLIWYDVDRF